MAKKHFCARDLGFAVCNINNQGICMDGVIITITAINNAQRSAMMLWMQPIKDLSWREVKIKATSLEHCTYYWRWVVPARHENWEGCWAWHVALHHCPVVCTTSQGKIPTHPCSSKCFVVFADCVRALTVVIIHLRPCLTGQIGCWRVCADVHTDALPVGSQSMVNEASATTRPTEKSRLPTQSH
jgi:hypothetical protein